MLYPKNWRSFLLWLAMVAFIGLLAAFGINFIPVPPPPTPIFNPDDYGMGWLEDPKEVERVASTLPFKVFADTPAGKVKDPLPDHIFLWDAFRQLEGKLPPTKNQGSIGSCVSFGTNNAILRTMAVEIAMFGRPFELLDIVEEATYGGSRVQAGHDGGGGDGSVGAWAAKFVNEWGIIARGKYDKYDLTSYSVSLCRSWGRSGLPKDLEPLAKKHPVTEITLVKSWDSAKKSLASGYGIAICSNQGFANKRDANGVARPSGSWAHCMCLDGYFIDGGGKEYGHIENSWGADWISGPVGWGNPGPGGFWAESAVIDRMLRAGDSWAFSQTKGFPARQIDWFVNRPRRAPIPFASVFERSYYASRN